MNKEEYISRIKEARQLGNVYAVLSEACGNNSISYAEYMSVRAQGMVKINELTNAAGTN